MDIKVDSFWYTRRLKEDTTMHCRWVLYRILSSCLLSPQSVHLSLVFWQWFRLCRLYQAPCRCIVWPLKCFMVFMDVVCVSGDSRRPPIWSFIHLVCCCVPFVLSISNHVQVLLNKSNESFFLECLNTSYDLSSNAYWPKWQISDIVVSMAVAFVR